MSNIQKTNEEIVETLGIAFDFTVRKTALYEDMLRDIPTPALDAAVEYIIMTSKLPPTIACIRKAAEVVGGYVSRMGSFYGE